MRWEKPEGIDHPGAQVLRVNKYPTPALKFMGLVYKVSKGRWIGEVFGKDLAKGFEGVRGEEEAKEFVEGNRAGGI